MRIIPEPKSAFHGTHEGNALAAVSLICSAMLIFSGCDKGKITETPTGPPTVTVITVQPKDVPVSIEKIAQTQSSQLVNIQARVSGFLDKRCYTEGAMVKKGQLLFQIDPKPFQVEVVKAKAAVSKQETALDSASLNLARIKPLAEVNAVSKKDLDDATSRYKSESAQLEQTKAQLESARLNLSYTTITSPLAGITGAAQQTEGTYISSQNSLLTTVAAISPIWVNFSISENEMLKVRQQIAKGMLKPPQGGNYLVEVILADGTLFPDTGRITFASPDYNSQTGTFLIRASLDNPAGALRPNQFVRVRLKGAIRPQALLLPQRAVQQGPKGHFVWVVAKDNKVEQRPVTVGAWEGNEWFIFEGVKGGETVVVDGGIALRPGLQVTVQPYAACSEPATGAAADLNSPETAK
jgi:membrane fusion protein, multidrug efflux system